MIHMRPFVDREIKNQEYLVNKNIEFTLVQITETGLKKGIMDATAPIRSYFYEHGIHDYETQGQGEEFKELVPAHILTVQEDVPTQFSLYRPVTKKGDPRFWIYRFKQYTNPDDIHAIIATKGDLFVINLTQIDIQLCCESNAISLNPIKELIQDIFQDSRSVAEELLSKFRRDSGIWHESEVTADTGIGRTIESMLGIEMNSSKLADYKGIELKSHREKRTATRNVLFTQTPDWNLSAYKSGKEIVEQYGYYRKGFFAHKTLEVTVKSRTPNSQNLLLNVNDNLGFLELLSQTSSLDHVAVWQLQELHHRLLTKHKETFWIEVESAIEDNKEYFRYKNIEHTKNPNVGQFDILLDNGIISLDLLLCRPSGHGDTYSFKIGPQGMPLLFPQSEIYSLI